MTCQWCKGRITFDDCAKACPRLLKLAPKLQASGLSALVDPQLRHRPDNQADQLNPRDWDERPDDWEQRVEEGAHRS
jgi:hypothetical protein